MSRGTRGTSLAVGVDVGGTWIRVLAVEDGRPVARSRTPASRVPELGSFLLRLQHSPRTALAALVVAARGIWTTAERRALARRLRGAAQRVAVISDAEAALLGAIGDRPGLLVLSGTGSIVLAHDGKGRFARAGGLGPLLGDEGSGFALGRAWLRRSTAAADAARARRIARAPDAVRRIAALAPIVVRRARGGDRDAARIVREAQTALAQLAVRAARELGLRSPITMSWAGSVMTDDWFRHGVARALRRAGVGAQWMAPEASPVEAAARLAERLPARCGRARGASSGARRPDRTSRPGVRRR